MKLTKKLLTHVHSVFERGSEQFLALRVRYDGSKMTWRVENGWLYFSVVGGSGGPYKVELSKHTVGTLAAAIALRPGYTVEYLDESTNVGLKAVVLMDGEGDQDKSNGDHLYAYSSLLWWYMEGMALELMAVSDQIVEALKQLHIKSTIDDLYNTWVGMTGDVLFRTEIIPPSESAQDFWLDEHGSYYNVPRNLNEPDTQYGPRIVAEVLRPRGNNKAIEMAIKAATGVSASVVDVGPLAYAGDIPECAGLFDVLYERGSNIQDPVAFANRVRAVVESMRDAGTFMRSLNVYLIYDGTYTYNGEVLHNATPL